MMNARNMGTKMRERVVAMKQSKTASGHDAAVEVPKGTGGGFGKWSNKDLDPSPPEARGWRWWYFFAFQFSIAFSPTTYNLGASMYAIGLTWWTIVVAASKHILVTLKREHRR